MAVNNFYFIKMIKCNDVGFFDFYLFIYFIWNQNIYCLICSMFWIF